MRRIRPATRREGRSSGGQNANYAQVMAPRCAIGVGARVLSSHEDPKVAPRRAHDLSGSDAALHRIG